MVTAMTAQVSAPSRVAPLRQSGWLLLVALLTFILALGYMIGAGRDSDADTQAAAQAAGKSINAIPTAEMARIASRYSTYFVISSLLLPIPFVLFAVGLRKLDEALRATTGATLARAAWWLGLSMSVLFIAFDLLSMGLLADPDNLPPLVRNIDLIMIPLTTFFTTLGLAAVIYAGLAARRAGVTPRTGLGAAIVAGIFLVLGIALFVGSGATDNLPPFAPFLAAPILAIGLVRTKEA